ncbi:MAG: primosomal protein N', partial [Oligoflexia bacterium]|nr:primosomal protein N' [Oligoflexia bacterium]
MYYYNVAPSRPFSEALAYDFDRLLPVGCKVEIPLGNSACYGYVIEKLDEKPEAFKTKTITRVADERVYFHPENLVFYKWVSDYYHYPLGETLSHITPSYKSKKPRKITETVVTDIEIQGPLFDFTDEQKSAFSRLTDPENREKFRGRNLLHGVTGSGKTEVYIEVIKETIREGKDVIVIVPEISLTPQLVKRISAHFRGEVSILHSGITPGQRYTNWMNLASGKSRLVIGARSAIFSPLKNLGLIIVDEEHDQSFKQDDRLRYNARDLALVLGKIFSARVILSSATPSTETYYNCTRHKYDYASISKRVLGLCLPSSVIVDMKKTSLAGRNVSEELASRIDDKLKKSEQVIIYINRRGYASTVICRDCGYNFKCPRCSITLTEHREQGLLLCHYCGHQRKLPDYCNVCHSDNLYSAGLGTERVYDDIQSLFTGARLLRMDSDSVKGRNELAQCLDLINRKEVDIIVGTQILGKGHDFPGVTLVGIINADHSLQLPDFRASERTFQQIMQVSGRA